MKGLLTERNIVVLLFVMVLITFSFAQKETRKMEQMYNGGRFSIKKFATPKFQPAVSTPPTSTRYLLAE